MVEACVLGKDCHLGSPTIDPLLESTASLVCGLLGSFEDECTSYLNPDTINLDSLDARTIFEIGSKAEYVDDVDLHQDGLDDLPTNYDDLGQAIVGSLGMDPARVYLTEIPDVTRDEFGDLCAWPTELPDFSEGLRIAAQQVPGVTQTEMEWASNYVLTELRAAMRAAANSEVTVGCSSTCVLGLLTEPSSLGFALALRDHVATEAAVIAARYVRLHVVMEVRMRRAYLAGWFRLKNRPSGSAEVASLWLR